MLFANNYHFSHTQIRPTSNIYRKHLKNKHKMPTAYFIYYAYVMTSHISRSTRVEVCWSDNVYKSVLEWYCFLADGIV